MVEIQRIPYCEARITVGVKCLVYRQFCELPVHEFSLKSELELGKPEMKLIKQRLICDRNFKSQQCFRGMGGIGIIMVQKNVVINRFRWFGYIKWKV